MAGLRVTGLTVTCLALAVASQGATEADFGDGAVPCLGQTWVEIGGQLYGAKPDDLGPLGGGAGYKSMVTEGNHRVRTVDELVEALKKAKSGETVYVDGEADIDCTTLVFAEKLVLKIPEGVTLAGNRGYQGSKGAIIYSDAFATVPLIQTMGPNVRITGLRIRGPDPKPRLDHHQRSFQSWRGDSAAQHKYYYAFPVSRGVSTEFPSLEVDNCELSGWSHAAVHLSSGDGHHVHHCYIHHNQMNGLGYGVAHGYGDKSESLIEYNVFDYNRHSIAGTGKPGNRYVARHNVEIEHSLSHNFDMHGGRDRQDGTDIAGDLVEIYNNTFRGGKIRALAIRGVPREKVDVHNNWFFHTGPGAGVISPWPTGGDTKVLLFNNAYGQDAPAVLDREYKDYQDAFGAGMTALQEKGYSAARTHFAAAAKLGTTGSERSAAQLQVAKSCDAGESPYGAMREYEKVMVMTDADAAHKAMAEKRLQKLKKLTAVKPRHDWSLVFSDDFERPDLGEDWEVVSGKWRTNDGKLVSEESGGAKIFLTRRFPGYHRLEFDAMSDKPCDLSAFIQSGAQHTSGSGEGPGYLLQFGASGNTVNLLRREGEPKECMRTDYLITPGKTHHIVAEFGGKVVQLVVDGQVVLAYRETEPLTGEGHDRVGFYIYSRGAIDNVKVFQAKGGAASGVAHLLGRLFGAR